MSMFKVEVTDAHSQDGGFDLAITHNCKQWTAVRINENEWPEVQRAVRDYLSAQKEWGRKIPK